MLDLSNAIQNFDKMIDNSHSRSSFAIAIILLSSTAVGGRIFSDQWIVD